MLIYQNTAAKFREDVIFNRVPDIMYENYQKSFNKKVGRSEFHSWQNTLHRISDVIEVARLKDNYVALEFSVPYNSSRIDCLIFGKSIKDESNIMMIELNKWEKVKSTSIEGNYVETYTGGGQRLVPHPSQQVKGYHHYLLDFVEEFEKQPMLNLSSCAYCHNYSRKDESGLFSGIYHQILDEFPVYCKEDVQVLADRLKAFLGKGEGTEIFNRFMQSRIRPSKKLLSNVKDIVKNGTRFSLLNEQLVAKPYNGPYEKGTKKWQQVNSHCQRRTRYR